MTWLPGQPVLGGDGVKRNVDGQPEGDQAMTDRPAAPERDRWDEQAERELPCSMECGGQLHAIGCLARLRPTYAAGLRKAYSDGVSDGIYDATHSEAEP